MILVGSTQQRQIDWIQGGTSALGDLPAGLFGSLGVAVVIVALAIVGMLQRGWQVALLVTWAVLPPVVTFLGFSLVHLFLPRYLLFTVPAWVLLAAGGVAFIAARVPVHRRVVLGAAGALVVVALLVVGWEAQQAVRRDDANNEMAFRDAGAYVAAHTAAGDGVVYDGYSRIRRAMAYEWRGTALQPRDVLMAQSPQQKGSFDAVECKQPATCLGGTPRLWLMTTRQGDDALAQVPGATGDALRAGYRVVGSATFRGLQVLELQSIAAGG